MSSRTTRAQRASAAQSTAAAEASQEQAPAQEAQAPAQEQAAPEPLAALTPEILSALRQLLASDMQAAVAQTATQAPAPAPAPAAKAPRPEPRRITLDQFFELHPDPALREDLAAAVMGTVFVEGGSWPVFRIALLGR